MRWVEKARGMDVCGAGICDGVNVGGVAGVESREEDRFSTSKRLPT